jgi:hypothetical protein
MTSTPLTITPDRLRGIMVWRANDDRVRLRAVIVSGVLVLTALEV